jgi:hypothetical protein
MSSPPTLPAAAHAKRASAFEVRTESFSTADLSKDAVSALKQEVHEEQFRRQSNPDLFAAEMDDEDAVESTTNTPAVEPREDQAMGVINHAAAQLTAAELPPPKEEEEEKQADIHPAEETADEKKVSSENEPPANPDKPTTGVEEEQGALKPAMPVSEDAVSGGQGLPHAAEDLRPQNKATEATPKKTEQTQQASATPKSVAEIRSTLEKRPPMSPRNSHKPEPVSTGSPKKATEGSLKSPSAFKSPTKERKSSSSSKATLSPTGTPKSNVVRKASRSSLSAPTAASAARERRESTVKPAVPAVKRETTKPANLPSHLTAPTAASRARQEAESNKPSTGRPSVSARAPPKQQISTNRPAARSSTATRPESRSTQQSAPRKTTTAAAPTESFLERMMRPTAASASKTHDKPAEPKSLPQRTKSSAAKPIATKTNGTAKPAAKSGSTSKSIHPAKPTEEKPAATADVGKKVEEKTETNGKAEETEMPDIPIPATENGTSTPQHGTENGQPAGAALESTPAFGEDQIR